MPVFKSIPVVKTINGFTAQTSNYAIVIKDTYTTSGENAIIIKDIPNCTITLDSKTTDHITIKSLTDTLIVSDYPIDDFFDEIELRDNASIELIFVKDGWFILSSDGLKT